MGTNSQVQPIYKESYSDKEEPEQHPSPGWGWLPPGLYRTTESCSLPSVTSDTISLVSVSKTNHLKRTREGSDREGYEFNPKEALGRVKVHGETENRRKAVMSREKIAPYS